MTGGEVCGVVFASDSVPASAFTTVMEKQQISVENKIFTSLSAYRLYVLH